MKLWRITRRDGSESHVVRAEDAKSARQHLAEQTGGDRLGIHGNGGLPSGVPGGAAEGDNAGEGGSVTADLADTLIAVLLVAYFLPFTVAAILMNWRRK